MNSFVICLATSNVPAPFDIMDRPNPDHLSQHAVNSATHQYEQKKSCQFAEELHKLKLQVVCFWSRLLKLDHMKS